MRKHVKNELLWICGVAALSLFLAKKRKAALMPAFASGFLLAQKPENDSLKGHSSIITGGSRGLGLALAKELLNEGCKVTLIARDAQELERAKQILLKLPQSQGRIHTFVCDVTDNNQLETAFVEVNRTFGSVDLLINNAGSIMVGPWELMEQRDFEAQMKLHVYAPMNAIRFALPYLRRPKSGKRVVNICSMGGRVAVPHMLPYDTSKFALSGFSQGVAAELGGEGISVTTIYPALMRTGSPIQAVFKGDHEKEFAWFQAGDIMPGLSSSAESSAKQIVRAAKERRWELMPSLMAKLRMAVGAFLPELMGQTMMTMNAFLPEGESREYKTGAQSRRLFDNSPITKSLSGLAHAPEEELNQEPKTDAKFNLGLH